jgi:hypothetical protein
MVFMVPIILFIFLWSVYNFGPKHHKQLLIEILHNPIPGIKFKGHLDESNDFYSLKRCRFNHNLISWHIARNKHLSAMQATRSSIIISHDCPMSNIDATVPKLYGYQTYATFHDTSTEQEITASAHSIPMTLYIAILTFSCPNIVFLSLPRCPPDGLITSFSFLILISIISTIITTCTCFLLSYK